MIFVRKKRVYTACPFYHPHFAQVGHIYSPSGKSKRKPAAQFIASNSASWASSRVAQLGPNPSGPLANQSLTFRMFLALSGL